jgi:hypothetical protein
LQGFGRRFNAHFLNNFLLRRVGKRNLPHEMGLPRWELAGTEEGSKSSMGRGLGYPCFPRKQQFLVVEVCWEEEFST